jgi:hypothetical protein
MQNARGVANSLSSALQVALRSAMMAQATL